jgi:hypothetical protein
MADAWRDGLASKLEMRPKINMRRCYEIRSAMTSSIGNQQNKQLVRRPFVASEYASGTTAASVERLWRLGIELTLLSWLSRGILQTIK